jgi:uncharacterized protein
MTAENSPILLTLRQLNRPIDVFIFLYRLIGPWAHSINVCALDEEDFGEVGKVADLYEQEIEFIKYFVASESAYDTAVAPIRLFVMGANLWRDEYEWPLARTTWTEMFLSSGGKANPK